VTTLSIKLRKCTERRTLREEGGKRKKEHLLSSQLKPGWDGADLAVFDIE